MSLAAIAPRHEAADQVIGTYALREDQPEHSDQAA
jgi:hypothetical protein